MNRSLRAVALAVSTVGVLAACAWLRPATEAKPAPGDASRPRYGLEARLRALHSAVSGKARIIDRGDGATLLLSMINVPEGRYRVALHQNANCSSPNGFSAGPPWAPAAAGKDPRDLVPPLSTNSKGAADASVYLPGVHTSGPDGVDKRSIVVYTGSDVTEARPDVPNNRIACGTFEASQPFEF